ncbi:MAG: opacity protein-like surface antigen [Polaribacter sp.]|jgi:opacity protein-like surface antigen
MLIAIFTTVCLQAQDYGGFVYGAKGGLSIGLQKWNNFEKDPLFSYQGALYIETLPVDKKFSVFAQSGYHVRGSAVRFNIININGGNQGRVTRKFEFNNISLAVGAKQRYEVAPQTFAYYMLGIRGEYTLNTNLCNYTDVRDNGFTTSERECPFDVFDDFTRDWNYGMILGGGVEFEFAERVGMLIEFSVNPDISQQYQQQAGIPRIFNNGSTNSNTNTYSEQLVRNTTLELSIGIRLLRLVEYID